MTKFEVTISRLRWEHTTITVEADSPAEALKKARLTADDEDAWNNADAGEVDGGTEIDVRQWDGPQVAFKGRDEP